MDLKDKTVAITGASSGIGLEILKALLKEGCRVAACARHIEGIGIEDRNLFTMACDVSKPEGIDAFFAFAEETLGSIDVYISNAGFAYYEKLEDPDWAHIESILNVNFISTVYAAEKMKQIHGDRPYHFVVTASAMGLLSLPGYALYSGTKAAVRGFADAYRHELDPGQHFQVVYPVATRTNFFSRAGAHTPVPWPTQDASVVARCVIRGIQKDKDHIFPSVLFRITNTVGRVFPGVFRLYVNINDKAFKNWLEKRQQTAPASKNVKERQATHTPEERTVFMDRQVKKYPAPWNLTGKGYIFLYKFNKTFVKQHGNVPGFLKGRFAGGFGSVMLVDYAQSDAGPYGELLFIPGKFKFVGKRLDTISKIYVSSVESVVNGRENWGIPKERADFSFKKTDDRTETVTVSVNGETAAAFTIRTGKPAFPVSTKLLPFPLVQLYNGNYYFTNFFGKGKGRFAKLKDISVNPELFPDISGCRPIAVLRVDPFDITFPKAAVVKGPAGSR